MDDEVEKTNSGEDKKPKEGFYVGQIINDKFIIEEQLGMGGMGLTYLASDTTNLRRKVVIKTVLKELATAAGKVAFSKEVEALGRIRHEGVVSLIDDGEDKETGLPFMVMEYVKGKPLNEIISRGQMDLKKAIDITQKIAYALNAAHKEGIYHRDLKPSNVMIVEDDLEGEKVKVIDFGVAKVADSVVGIETKFGTFRGTLEYASPEQVSHTQTIEGETYSLALLTYEMLTQKRPFQITVTQTKSEDTETFKGRRFSQLKKLQNKGAENPSHFNPAISEETAKVILKGLEYDLNNRYENPIIFAKELRKSISEKKSEREPTAETLEMKEKVVEVDENQKPKWKKGFAFLAILALLMTGFLGYLFWDNVKPLVDSKTDNEKPLETKKQIPETLFSYSFAEVVKMKNNIVDGRIFKTTDISQIREGDKFHLIVERKKQGQLYLVKQSEDKFVLLNAEEDKTATEIKSWNVSNPNQSIWLVWSKDKIDLLEKDTLEQSEVEQFLQKNNKTLETDKKSDKIEVKGKQNIGVYKLNL